MAENTVDRKGSPFWWFKRLSAQQSKRLDRLDMLQAWLDNDPPLPPTAPKWQEATQDFYKSSRTNLAHLTTESARERMTPIAFRTAAERDENGDKEAAKGWSANHMPTQTMDLFTDMLGRHVGYTMVGPARKNSEVPIITVEDPRSIITAPNPERPWEQRAGFKTLHDPDEEIDVAWVYVQPDEKHDPNRVTAYRFWKPGPRAGFTSWGPRFRLNPKQWRMDDPVTMPVSRVPITPFFNHLRVADFEPHIPHLERINRQTLQRMLIAELQAFKQRAIKGLMTHYPDDFPVEKLRGQEIDYEGIFTPGPGALWQVPGDVDFWESGQIDLRPMLAQEQMDIRTYMALTRIPMSYLTPDDANGSAEGASLQREGLVYRVEDRRAIADDGLKMTMSHYFEFRGDTKRMALDGLDVVWDPIERLSLAERYSAASQAQGFLPRRTIQREVLGWTPKQMEDAADDAASDFLFNQRPVDPQTPLSVPSQRVDQPVPIAGAPATPPASV